MRFSVLHSTCIVHTHVTHVGYACVCDVQEALRQASFVVNKLATQLSADIATAYSRQSQLSKRNSGVLDIVLGMPDLMANGRK